MAIQRLPLVAAGLFLTQNAIASPRLSSYVDPLIGTEGATAGSAIAGGNSFPGASRPWGMAKVGIDTSYIGVRNATDCNAGFSPLGNVTGVSMLHVSGTGGAPTYGLISQMPIYGNLEEVNLANNMTYWQNRSMETEKAEPGYFRTVLLDGTTIELAGSQHAGIMRYSFPGTQTGNNSAPSIGYSSRLSTASTHGDDVHVVVDLTHILPAYSEPYNTSAEGARFSDVTSYSQRYIRGDLHLREEENGMPSYFGSAMYAGGWPNIAGQTVFFCGNFSSSDSLMPTSEYVEQRTSTSVSGAGTFAWAHHYEDPLDFALRPIPKSYMDTETSPGGYMGIGALFSWSRAGTNASSPSVVESRVGISYISASQACENIANELPSSKSFEDAVAEAKDEWEGKVLSTVEVVDDGSSSSQNQTLKRMLYSAMYQTGLMPTEKTHENPHWNADDELPYFDDYYTLWDTYRSVMPLYHLLYTGTYIRMIKGLINIFTFEGFLPAGRAGNYNGRVQGGTHADMSLADAYVKSVVTPDGQEGLDELGDIDWKLAYRAVLNDANNLPVHNEDPVTPDGATKEGRGALDDYLPLHFITRNHSRSISRGLEYSQNDYAIWSMAKGLNASTEQIQGFHDRSSWWQNQWNPNANTTLNGTWGTFTGFPAPRNSDGSWNYTDYDPLTCGGGGCGWPNDIYEAKVWETAFSAAPHDMGKLIELMGGDEAFVKRLDASFVPGLVGDVSVGANNDAGSALYNPGNEPSFMTPFLYNYVPGHQYKAVNQTRAIVDQFYSDRRFGYPGNIDAGAIPSWLVFNLLGFYPVAAQPIYLLGAPRFSHLKLKLFTGTDLERILDIRAEGLDEERGKWWPQQVTLNGKKLDRSWVWHAEIARGGELVFEMGSEPGKWDTGERPPSLSEYQK